MIIFIYDGCFDNIKFSNFDICINIVYWKINEILCVYDDDENEILLDY